jgi:uncharacterized membrane protein YoaK (UPF0700 family)
MRALLTKWSNKRLSDVSRAAAGSDSWIRWLPPVLSFVAGYVDTTSFVALFGLFTAHITGNFVVIGAALVHSGSGIIAKLLVLSVFVLTVAAVRLLTIGLRARKREVVRTLLSLEAAFLLSFMLAGVALGPFSDADAPIAVLTGTAATVAMALQNAAMRDSLGHVHPTTMMTGNITQAVFDLIDLGCGIGDPHAREIMRLRTRRLLLSLAAFTLGCLLAATGVVLVGFWCLALPLGLTILMAAAAEASILQHHNPR